MDPRPQLRVAIVVGRTPVPVWMIQCIEEIETSKIAECVLVIKIGSSAKTSLRSGFLRRLRGGLFDLYLALDRRRFRRELQLLGGANLESILPSCPVLNLPGVMDEFTKKGLHENRLDIILDPMAVVSHGVLAPFARFGVWGLRPGGKGTYMHTSGFWEVAHNYPATETFLTLYRSESKAEAVVDTLSVPTHAHSVARSQAYIYAHVPALILRKMRALWEEGPVALESREALVPLPMAKVPGNLQMVPVLARMAKRAVANRVSTTFYRGQWSLAYQWKELPIDAGLLHYLKPPSDRFWADPFPVQVGDTYFIFHEEVAFSTLRGSIALTTLDKSGRHSATVPVLVKDYHLSYPFIFEWDGDFFMMPESSAAQRIDLYRCTGFPMQWKFEKTLFTGMTAYDSTLAFISGMWWLFTSQFPSNASTLIHELHLFHAPSPLGPWTAHRRNPVKRFNVISTRPAGRIFEVNGCFYRPAQDCSKRYGYGVTINRILRITPEDYEEIEEKRILPDWNTNVLGVHTLNHAGDLVMIDCLMWRHK